MKKFIVFAFVATLAIAGCKKKADGIVGTWKVTAATANPAVDLGNGPVTDVYPYIFSQPCSQDNLLIFKEGNTVILDEGALKCDTSNAQQSSATYTLVGSALTIYDSNDTTALTNVTIDEDYLKGVLAGGFNSGSEITLTFTRQ